MALESFPPLFLVCVRFLASGLAILVAALILRWPLPRGRELLRTAVNGVVILGIGNGCLVFAEQWIPSGLAALFITTSPFWMVAVEAAVPGGESLHAPTMAGMALGFTGVALLVAPGGWKAMPVSTLTGLLTLQLGCAGWAVGSIFQRRETSSVHPIVSGGVQQLATGLMFLLPALLLEHSHPIAWSVRGVLAMLYLVVFGSIVGYSAYIFALENLPVAVVSIYTYVNPIVAVLLGWLFYREPFGAREAFALLVIFAGVAVVKRFSRKPQRRT